ncbi:MAG TPA: DUF2258 domain-containing protein [Ignisphaera aggregans]|uniref:DUF2258 domain-containing protein n=1 Tax=Ignisphaera aggregans TaxID=334771 RepID=A0A832YZ21_9CREN|nr:DUF2258 domain-containing protein [Ignisphaera aggregans]
MPMLSSGLVIAGAYADKVRRTLFAQMRDYVKQDKTWAQRVAYAAAQLNRFLYTILVEQLKIDKGDVVRVRIEYEIDEAAKEIKWKWDTLQLEAFRRIPQNQVDALVKQFIARAAEVSTAVVAYSLKKLGETFDGDIVYTVTLDDKEVGAVVIMPVNENLAILKVGAVIEPTPAIFEKAKLEIPAGQDLESVLKNALSTVMQVAKHVSYDEALKIVNAIRSKVAAKPMEAIEVEEEEES